jgi:hypothetical protein
MSFEHEEREPVDYGLRMAALARSFHCLAEADGVLPWDPERFVRWMHSGAPGHGARCAGQFVLSVWNPYTDWSCGRFDLHEALGIWDSGHRAAFIAWVRSPWWP